MLTYDTLRDMQRNLDAVLNAQCDHLSLRPNPLFVGMRIIESQYACKLHYLQYRFPRSKKVRIRKKWAKNPANWRTTMEPLAFKMDGVLIVHPSIAAEMRKQFQ